MMQTCSFLLLWLLQAINPHASGRGAAAEDVARTGERRQLAGKEGAADSEWFLMDPVTNASQEQIQAQIQALEDLLHHGGDDHGSHGHQHDALLYLVLVLMLGTMILHLTTLPHFHKLPYTVVMFVLGLLSSFVYEILESSHSLDDFGVFAKSYEMWMAIDPHLLIFTMLPVLLTGDAMAIDTSVAKRVSGQCLWLAGPGVLLGSFGTALFLWVYLQWEFLLCLACGSILAATDPVAVVGLLKELGASPILTVQIQGESLLNDGTAMVLFNVAYNMLKGETHNVKSILILLVYMVGCAWFLGMVIGGVFASWIRAAGKRMEHHSNMIQISLTICCAYGSFVLAEGVVGISGVLSTVAASLVLAHTIWPKIVSHEAMHEVWHTFEYIGNTLIFFLAGALGGQSMWKVNPIAYLHLVVIYVVLIVLRASIMLGSRPILRLLSPDRTPVSAADALVMSWGGLRGAVGLALAIQLYRNKADNKIDDQEANEVFFFTAGIAFLTLIINATTCPKLVTWLGIAATPKAKNRIMGDIVHRLKELCEDEKGAVKSTVQAVLEEVMHHLHEEDEKLAFREPSSFARQFSSGWDGASKPAFEVVAEFHQAKQLFEAVPERNRELLGWDGKAPLLNQQESIAQLVLDWDADTQMIKTINEAFLSLVRADIWAQIQRGEFVETTRSGEALLNSNTKAFERAGAGLSDYENLQSQLGIETKVVRTNSSEKTGRVSRASRGVTRLSGMGIQVEYDANSDTCLGRSQRLVSSVFFQGTLVFVIVCNAFAVFFDPGVDSDRTVTYLVFECCFMAVYLVDLVVKLSAMRMGYFVDGWNALDFMCVTLGLFAIIVTILVQVGALSPDGISSEMLLISLGRVFKVMRVMRIMSLIKFAREMRARLNSQDVHKDIAARLETIFTLRGFVQAHLHSHNKFLRYFGAAMERCACGNKLMGDAAFCRKCGAKRPDTMTIGCTSLIEQGEQARCILESFTSMYNAAIACSLEASKVDNQGRWILEGLCTLRESVGVTKHLTNFVFEAAHDGVILAKDAESIMHPMMDHLRKTDVMFADAHKGIHSPELRRHSSGSRSSVGCSEDGKDYGNRPLSMTSTDSTPLQEEEDMSKPGFFTPEREVSPGSASSSQKVDMKTISQPEDDFPQRTVSPCSLVSGVAPEKNTKAPEPDKAPSTQKIMPDRKMAPSGEQALRQGPSEWTDFSI